MKYDFYFVHGWAFDSTFWDPVKYMIKNELFSSHVESIDLNFFKANKIKNQFSLLNFNKNKKVFIVHSYGFNWFIKKKIKCNILINFFGCSDFINFQRRPSFTEKKIDFMIENLNKNPEKILQNFYKDCRVECLESKEKNLVKLKSSLINLKKNISQDINNNLKIHSIYSANDKILNIDKKKVKLLETENHKMTFFKNFDHGFPFNQPKMCFRIIKKIIINKNHELS